MEFRNASAPPVTELWRRSSTPTLPAQRRAGGRPRGVSWRRASRLAVASALVAAVVLLPRAVLRAVVPRGGVEDAPDAVSADSPEQGDLEDVPYDPEEDAYFRDLPEGAGDYSRDAYLLDMKSGRRDIRLAEAHLESNRTVLECGVMQSKYPLLKSSRVGALEQELFTEISQAWLYRYNDYIRYSHMAMLEQWGDLLVAAWQASPAPRNLLLKNDGTKEIVVEGLQDQRLIYSVSRDFGKTWEAPLGLLQVMETVPVAERGAVWSPVLHASAGGKLWLFYSQSVDCSKTLNRELRWAPGGDIKAVTLHNAKSLTAGVFDSSDVPSWSIPQTILQQGTDGIPKVVANKLLVLSSGEWVLPFWREKPDAEAYQCMRNNASVSAEVSSAGVLISGDGGRTWQAHGVLHDLRSVLLEGSLVELRGGDLLMLFRSRSGCMWRSVSSDKGRTWRPPQPTHVPNPNSKIHVIRIEPSGHLVMAFNNHRRSFSHGDSEGAHCRACRTNLALAVSSNEGRSWNEAASIDAEITPGVRIHYPTLQQVGDVLFVIFSKFYLYREPGEWSPDQGIRIARYNISRLLSVAEDDIQVADQSPRLPTRQALVEMLSHFIENMDDETRGVVQTRRFRGNAARKQERQWRWLSDTLAFKYDMDYLGPGWLHGRTRFGRYAVSRVWSEVIAAMKEEQSLLETGSSNDTSFPEH